MKCNKKHMHRYCDNTIARIFNHAYVHAYMRVLLNFSGPSICTGTRAARICVSFYSLLLYFVLCLLCVCVFVRVCPYVCKCGCLRVCVHVCVCGCSLCHLLSEGPWVREGRASLRSALWQRCACLCFCVRLRVYVYARVCLCVSFRMCVCLSVCVCCLSSCLRVYVFVRVVGMIF